MIEQAKFTYPPLRKAFEKQTKTIEDQGEKQFNALKSLESLKPKELKEVKPIEYSDYGGYFLKGLDEIRKNKQLIDFLDLTYNFKDPKIAPIHFIRFEAPNRIFKSIHNGDIALEDVEKEQTKHKSDLKYINPGPKYNKSPEQLNTIKNLKNIYE